MNEETEDATQTPGKAAVVSTFLLLGIYLLVSVAALAFHGVGFLNDNSDDVLSALGKDVARLAVGQAADHRRAHVGVGVDADDDPADDALDAVDGDARRDPAALRSHPSEAT